MFWLVGAMNAINLLDGIDGLATSLGIILSATIGVLAAMKGNYGVAVIATVMTGSLAGFLPYNLPPARMYLGDAGSMLIGLMVGAMAVRALLKTQGTFLLAAPLAIWAIPMLDSGAAILRRQLTGRSVYATDRGHIHHRLLQTLGSNIKVLMVVSACCLLTSVGAVLSVWFQHDLIAVISCLSVVAMLLITGAFGRAECRLLLSRAAERMCFTRPPDGYHRLDKGIEGPPARGSRMGCPVGNVDGVCRQASTVPRASGRERSGIA